MRRSLKKFVQNRFPSFALFLRAAEDVLSGRRFDALERSLNGGAFGPPTPDFILHDSLARLHQAAPGGAEGPRLAVIGAMPPSKTGIAYATLRSFQEAPYPVDVFTAGMNVDAYLALALGIDIARSNMRIFALDCLAHAQQRHGYVAQLFCLGNSEHSLPYLRALRRQPALGKTPPRYVHLHDPCVHHLLRRSLIDPRPSHADMIARIYGPQSAQTMRRLAGRFYDVLTDRGISGAAALLGDDGLAGIFVNSAAAEAWLAQDFAQALPAPLRVLPPVRRLFHPVFAPSAAPAAAPLPRLRIGSFGLPATAKRTELVVAAFRLLRQQHPDAELLLAGYTTANYAARLGLRPEDGFQIVDSPTEAQMDMLMRSCHLAVQLRDRNLGESSGVVAQLIATRTATIVSDIGAFAEYGDAVATIPAGADAPRLLAAIIAELGRPGSRDAAMAAYAQAHQPVLFCTALLEYITHHQG